MRSIRALNEAISEGTRGNLAVHVEVPGSDELAQISKEFENMLNVLSTLVADVRSASSMVTHVGAQLVEDGHSLSQRTQSQAVSLEEAASNVGQVSDITKVISADTFERPIYAGNAIAIVQSLDATKVITVRTTGFDAAAATGGAASVETLAGVADSGKSSFVGAEIAKSAARLRAIRRFLNMRVILNVRSRV